MRKRPLDGKRTKLVGKYMLRVPCEHRGDRLLSYSRPTQDLRGASVADLSEYGRNCAVVHECNICQDCGAWLSLGPSNDEPEAVQIEMRAVRLATNPLGVGCIATASEWIGWMSDHLGTRLVDHSNEFLSGYLARCIATHEEP